MHLPLLHKSRNNNPLSKPAKSRSAIAKTGLIFRKYIALFLGIAIGITIAFAFDFFNWQKKSRLRQSELLKLQNARHAELAATEKNKALATLMNGVIDQINSELSRDPKRTLSDETITRVAALSYSFTPYARVNGESIGTKTLSPERGHLLLVISGMRIDTVSLDNIFRQSIFSSADLRNANLENAYLKGVNLHNADLQQANLSKANLIKANLKLSNLWGANLQEATLISADLQSVDASWANLNKANFSAATLNKALLKSAQLRQTNLQDAGLQRVNFNGALLEEANLDGADLLSVMMNRTNLSSANLTGVNLLTSTLTDVIFSNAVVSQDWFAKLKEWKVNGSLQIEERYRIVSDTGASVPRYRLIPR